ncbi:TPA: hypothetical protein ACGOYQ_000786 [Streptococcus suis]
MKKTPFSDNNFHGKVYFIMKFCNKVDENEDTPMQVCTFCENIKKMLVARKQLQAFSSCVWRALFSINIEKYLILWYNFSNISLREKLR